MREGADPASALREEAAWRDLPEFLRVLGDTDLIGMV